MPCNNKMNNQNAFLDSNLIKENILCDSTYKGGIPLLRPWIIIYVSVEIRFKNTLNIEQISLIYK